MNDKYNGWTNYATWRVNLEMFDGQPAEWIDAGTDAYDLGQSLRDTALEYMAEQASGLALDYAEAFLADVNWYEIAKHMLEDVREAEGARTMTYDPNADRAYWRREGSRRLIEAARDSGHELAIALGERLEALDAVDDELHDAKAEIAELARRVDYLRKELDAYELGGE